MGDRLKEKREEIMNSEGDKLQKFKNKLKEKREQLKEKFEDSMLAEKLAERCENGEARKGLCDCLAVMKVDPEDRSDEQKQVAKVCWQKWKENRGDGKLADKIKEQIKEKVQEKIENVKNQVKECRQIRRALKEKTATIEQKRFHLKNCRRNVFKKRQTNGNRRFG